MTEDDRVDRRDVNREQSDPNGQTGLAGDDGGSSWLPAGTRWTPLTILVVVVVLGGVAAGGAYVATGGEIPLIGGGDDSTALDTVPEGVDVVADADSSLLEDGTTETLVDGALSASSGVSPVSGASSYDELLEEIDNETDLDVDDFESGTIFAKSDDVSPTGTEYAAAIVESDWSEDDLVSAIEANGESMEERTYGGTTVYVGSASGTDGWLVALGSGTFVVGSETAVTDAIDVENGDMSAFSGDLRESFTDLEDGYVRFAATMPAQAEQADVLSGVGQITGNVESVAGVYYTNGTDVGMEIRVIGTDESGAETIEASIDAGLSLATLRSENDATSELIDAVELQREGTQVTISLEYPAEELVTIMDRLSQGTGPTV